jgi:23S rRNA (cytosine1962-C5)-methyltransferase
MIDLVLKPGRDRSVRRRHPWVLSGSVARVVGGEEPGALVRVLSAEGEPLGWGHLSPASVIRVRLAGFGKEAPAESWLEDKLEAALEARGGDVALRGCDAVRLVNAEGDGLPGLIVDRYADTVVAKVSSDGMAQQRERLADALRRATGAARGYERADAAAARQEGFASQEGSWWGPPPPETVAIQERGRRYVADVVRGQKTGFYLDQRDARSLVQELSEGRRVLDLFSYTGGFALAAAQGGAASLTLVETSAPALALARGHLEGSQAECSFHEASAFQFVRGDKGEYDLAIVDPPPLARRRRDVTRATRAYKDVLLHTMRRLAPGGLLLAFACSHHVGADLFRKVVFAAALDAARPLQVLRALGAPSDHPVSIDHPEGDYLHGLLLRA